MGLHYQLLVLQRLSPKKQICKGWGGVTGSHGQTRGCHFFQVPPMPLSACRAGSFNTAVFMLSFWSVQGSLCLFSEESGGDLGH